MYNFQRDIAQRQRAALQKYSAVVAEEPTTEAIGLEDARKHCRVDTFGSPPTSDDDPWFEDIGIPAARGYCEAELGMSLAPKTYEISASAFPAYGVAPAGAGFPLPFGPVQSIQSIIYLDQAAADAAYTAAYDASFAMDSDAAAAVIAGNAAAAAALEVTVDPAVYAIDGTVTPARLILAYGQAWPAARVAVGSVRVRYVAGFSIPGESPGAYPLPPLARAAMLLMLEHLYEHRGDESDVEIPKVVYSLLNMVTGRERLGFA